MRLQTVLAQDSIPTPTPDPESILPPSGGGEITIAGAGDEPPSVELNKNFTGAWKARVKRPAIRKLFAHISEDSFGSSIITLKLCVKDGKLSGTVHQGGVFVKGVISSQTIISKNEVEFVAKSKDGKTTTIRLKLTGERTLIGTFLDGHTFNGRKVSHLICIRT